MEPGDESFRYWTIRYGDESETDVLRNLRFTLSWVMGSDALNLTVYGIIFWMTRYFKRYDKKMYKKIKRTHYIRD